MVGVTSNEPRVCRFMQALGSIEIHPVIVQVQASLPWKFTVHSHDYIAFTLHSHDYRIVLNGILIN